MSRFEPFQDNDISASTRSKARRPAFEQMIDLIEAGEIDAVVFYSNSRLTRRPREFEDIIELVERTGLQLNSVVSGQADLSTADGRQIARMLAAADAAEAERTSERVTRAFVQRREQGLPNPSSRTFGFEKGGMVVVEKEAELIREAARRIADEGWSLGQVVADWNERKIPTTRGAGRWHRITVSRAILNPRTAGMIHHRGEILGRGAFDAILSVDLQKRVKAALEGNRKGNTVNFEQRKHALAGFLVCGKCGRPMKVNGLRDEEGKYRKDSFVICSRTQYGCGRLKRNLVHVEEYIDLIVRRWIEDRIEPAGDGGVSEEVAEKADELQARLREIEEDIADLQAAFNAGEMRFKDYNPALAALRNLQELTEKALADLNTVEEIDPDMDMLAQWEDGDIEDKRLVLTRALDHVKLHPVGKVGPIRAKEMIPQTTEVVFR